MAGDSNSLGKPNMNDKNDTKRSQNCKIKLVNILQRTCFFYMFNGELKI